MKKFLAINLRTKSVCQRGRAMPVALGVDRANSKPTPLAASTLTKPKVSWCRAKSTAMTKPKCLVVWAAATLAYWRRTLRMVSLRARISRPAQTKLGPCWSARPCPTVFKP